MKYVTDIPVDKLKGVAAEKIRSVYAETEKKKILEYFGRFDPVLFTSQPVIDAFTGEQVAEADNGYSDGEYTWYQSEIYYFEHYDMKLHKHFIDHGLKHSGTAE